MTDSAKTDNTEVVADETKVAPAGQEQKQAPSDPVAPAAKPDAAKS